MSIKFIKSPLSCLGLARWLPVNAGDVAMRYIKDPDLLRFIDIECFCWSVMPAHSHKTKSHLMTHKDHG